MNYKVTIENGVTIINTGDAIGGLKNKSGHVGIHYLEKEDKYLAKIFLGKKYCHLGRYKTLEEAVAVRAEAEKHREDGTLLEWIETLPFKHRRKKSAPKSK